MKNMKKLIVILFIILSSTVYGQQNTMNENKQYNIGGYTISPLEKKVCTYHTIAYEKTRMMSDGSTMNAWIQESTPINLNIDFNTTSLVFMGNIISFKEFLGISTIDVSSLEVIRHAIGANPLILSPLENKVHSGNKQLDVTGYTHLRNGIFKDHVSEQLFYIPYDNFKLEPISLVVDENTLHHLTRQFFVDKNGLYDFETKQQLESSYGKVVHPTLFENYLIYGDAAYTYSEVNLETDEDLKIIRLDATKLHEIHSLYDTYMGDASIFLKLPYHLKNLSSIVKRKDIIQINTPKEPIEDWNNFDTATVIKDNNIAYYPSHLHAKDESYTYNLIKTSNGFYGVVGDSLTLTATKLDDVMIYNVDRGDDEQIDVSQFRRVTINFYIYKNRLYYTDGKPVITNINLNQLTAIRLNGQETEFYTDGKSLLAGYNLGKLEVDKSGDVTQMTLTPLHDDVDWASLHIVNEKILVDNKNIYKSRGGDTGEVIPIKELGVNVIVK